MLQIIFYRINKYFEYKRNSIDHENCEYVTESLYKYNEDNLFLCNPDFRKAFYDIFNCTPFYSVSNSNLDECPLMALEFIKFIYFNIRKSSYKCKICPESFINSRKLKVHMGIHTGIYSI